MKLRKNITAKRKVMASEYLPNGKASVSCADRLPDGVRINFRGGNGYINSHDVFYDDSFIGKLEHHWRGNEYFVAWHCIGNYANPNARWETKDFDTQEQAVDWLMSFIESDVVESSTKTAKRKVMAAALGEFYDSDFKRMMEQIVDNIVDEWDHEGDPDDFISTQLGYEIDTECTYYSDCINIIWASHTTDWSDADYQISSLGQLAAWIIEREFYDEGYYDDALERMTGEDEEDEED